MTLDLTIDSQTKNTNNKREKQIYQTLPKLKTFVHQRTLQESEKAAYKNGESRVSDKGPEQQKDKPYN